MTENGASRTLPRILPPEETNVKLKLSTDISTPVAAEDDLNVTFQKFKERPCWKFDVHGISLVFGTNRVDFPFCSGVLKINRRMIL